MQENVMTIHEILRQVREEMAQNLKYSLRLVVRNPGYSATVALTLLLGIAAITTVFGLVNGILLHPFPFRDADRLCLIWETNSGKGLNRERTSPAAVYDWSTQPQLFEGVVGFSANLMNLTGYGEPEMVHAYKFSPGIFRLLGVTPMLGRAFSAEEEQPGGPNAVVIRYTLWKRYFNGDPNIIGKKVLLQDQPYTIIGVMPPEFVFFSRESELIVPLPDALAQTANRGQRTLRVIARLKPGVTFAQAQTRLQAIAQRWESDSPQTNAGWGVRLVSLQEDTTGNVRSVVLILFGAVTFVLFIACANVVNLSLARALGRSGETAVAMALGASRGRLIRQALTENMLLGLIAGVLALPLSYGAVRTLVGLIPDRTGFGKFLTSLESVRIDGWVLAFAIATSLLAGLCSGLLPALRVARSSVAGVLRESGRSRTGGPWRNQLRSAVVIGEVAAASVLVIGAGLLLRTFVNMLRINPGFQPRNVVTMMTFLPGTRYRQSEQVRQFYQQVIERLEQSSGVLSAAAVDRLPLEGYYSATNFLIEGRALPRDSETPRAVYKVATPNFFTVFGIPRMEGRFFTGRDSADAPPVVIVNDALVRRYWPGESPIGKRIRPEFGRGKVYEIVGVVGAVAEERPGETPVSVIYVPHYQMPDPLLAITVRTASDPRAIPALVRRVVHELDPGIPIYRIVSMDEMVVDSLWQTRFAMMLLIGLSSLALLLAAIGLYSLIHYSVAQQIREIGVRLALGAQKADVMRLVLGAALKLCLTGALLGVAAAFALTRALASILYGVTSSDPLTFAVVPALLLLVATAASYFPARKAARADPILALRAE
jgi:putative ABC transport system permease protein